MRRGGALLVVALLAACGVRTPAPAVDPIELPEIVAPGPPASEIEGPLVEVTVLADGTVLHNGEEQDRESLMQILYPVAEASRDESDEMRRGRAALLVRADRRTEIMRVGVPLSAAAHPDVRIDRIFFVVRGSDGEEGTLFTPLAIVPSPDRGLTIEVTITPGADPAPAETLLIPLRRIVDDRGGEGSPVWISPRPGVSLGFVLRAFDVARRAGATAVRLAGDGVNRPPEPSPVRSEEFEVHIGDFDLRESLPDPRPAELLAELDRLAGEAGEDGAIGDTPTTSLAILACLAAGESHKRGPHKAVAREGLRRLKQIQDPTGLFPDAAGEPDFEVHVLGTFAMVRAIASTASPLYRQSAQRALDRLVRFPDPDSYPDADWAAAAYLSAARTKLVVPDDRLAWAEFRLGVAPGDPPETVDPRDWLPGLLRAEVAGGEVAARWRAAALERLAPTRVPDSLEGRAMRAFLVGFAWGVLSE